MRSPKRATSGAWSPGKRRRRAARASLGGRRRDSIRQTAVSAGNLDYRDIRFNVQFQDSRVTQIEFVSW